MFGHNSMYGAGGEMSTGADHVCVLLEYREALTVCGRPDAHAAMTFPLPSTPRVGL
jgi:hypothetical protein